MILKTRDRKTSYLYNYSYTFCDVTLHNSEKKMRRVRPLKPMSEHALQDCMVVLIHKTSLQSSLMQWRRNHGGSGGWRPRGVLAVIFNVQPWKDVLATRAHARTYVYVRIIYERALCRGGTFTFR